MEKDILQYIIVVIAIIVWVVSKVTKAAKKENTSTAPPVSPKQSKSLDDWWKELSQEIQTETAPQSAPVTVRQKIEQPIDRINPNYFEELHKNYKNAEFTAHKKPLKTLEIIDSFDDAPANKVYKPLNINLKHKDEARRALIYSEIFNRKY